MLKKIWHGKRNLSRTTAICTMKITTTFFHRQLLVGLFFPVPGTLQKYWRPYRKAPFVFWGLGWAWDLRNIVPKDKGKCSQYHQCWDICTSFEEGMFVHKHLSGIALHKYEEVIQMLLLLLLLFFCKFGLDDWNSPK